MQMVKNSLIAFIVVWLGILVFMPKQESYYKLEEALAKHEIKLNETNIDEGLFSLNLKDVTVYFKGINVATIEEVSLFTLLFYNSIELQLLIVDDSLKKMLPQEIKSVVARHSILSPLEVSIDASGSFGSALGNIDLNEGKVRLDFNESKNIDMLKSQLKKDEKGWYYETSF